MRELTNAAHSSQLHARTRSRNDSIENVPRPLHNESYVAEQAKESVGLHVYRKGQIRAVGVDPGSIFGLCLATLALALRSCCSSSKQTSTTRLLREPSSVDYQAKRGVEHWMGQRGDQIKHKSRKRLRESQSDGSSFFNPFPLQAASRHHFSVYQPFIRGSVSSYSSSSTLACSIHHKHECSHNYSH